MLSYLINVTFSDWTDLVVDSFWPWVKYILHYYLHCTVQMKSGWLDRKECEQNKENVLEHEIVEKITFEGHF